MSGSDPKCHEALMRCHSKTTSITDVNIKMLMKTLFVYRKMREPDGLMA